jgi:peptide/nickel transport system ATP-binding protein
MSKPSPLIEVENLRVRLNTSRGPADAVRDVSFSLARGGTLGLIGESGCGKSVTALALMGLLPESAVISGSIRLDGQELIGLADSDYCKLRGNRVSMIFQEPMTALNPMHTIGRQIAEPLRRHKGFSATQARSETIALLDRVGLPDAAKRVDAYPHQFSGGQRQRITIAMALSCEPDILIADEPTTALDVTTQAQILALLRRLQRTKGVALMLITHDMGVIAQMADDVAVMYLGRMVEFAPVTQLFAAPQHPYTRALLWSVPNLRATPRERLATIGGAVPHPGARPVGCPFHPRCPEIIKGRCETVAPPEIPPGERGASCFHAIDQTMPSHAEATA